MSNETGKNKSTEITTEGGPVPRLETVIIESLDTGNLLQLCEATRESIAVGEGFSWLNIPEERVLENYWKGVVLMRERTLFVARMDGQIAGCAQLVRPPASNEAGSFRGEIVNFFIAPWARGYGLAKSLIKNIEDFAIAQGCRSLEISMRSDQLAAIAVCEWLGMEKFGEKKRFASIDNVFLPGYFYAKDLD